MKTPEKVLAKNRRYREAHPEKVREWRKQDGERHIERIRAYQKAYREANRDELNRKRREWRRRNPEKLASHTKKYQQNHPDKMEQFNGTRRERDAKAEGTFTPEDFKRMMELHGGVCLSCGTQNDIEADHVIPVSRGGSHDLSNRQPLCRSCNARKYCDITDYRIKKEVR